MTDMELFPKVEKSKKNKSAVGSELIRKGSFFKLRKIFQKYELIEESIRKKMKKEGLGFNFQWIYHLFL